MKITSAEYFTSALTLDACPAADLPEFALIGRSNVGKSSILNMLSVRKDLARVSATPGHTRMINFYTINKSWRLVDLPGYGYAKVAKTQRHKFNEFVSDYLVNRDNLSCVFLLIDGSLQPQPLDLQFAQWLISVGVPFVLVFTKIDKVGPNRLQENIALFKEDMAAFCDNEARLFTCSTRTKAGLAELHEFISKVVRK